MKNSLIASIFACCASLAAAANIDYVSMFIGSTGKHRTEYGGTTPAVGAPFAMTQWCAATRVNLISKSAYNYKDTNLIGFMGTHQPCIWMGDYGFITFMPQLGETRFDVVERAQRLEHSREKAAPYLYELEFDDFPRGAIKTSITATSRCAVAKIKYSGAEEPSIMVEVARGFGEGGLEVDLKNNELRVYNAESHDEHLGPKLEKLRGYYIIKFDKKIAGYIVFENSKRGKEKSLKSRNGLAVSVIFDRGAREVEARFGSSFISYEQARENMRREIDGLSFGEVKERVKAQWAAYLDKVEISGATDDEKTMFYTSLFRTLQYPREFSEYGRYYSAFDDSVHKGESYNAYSMWDTFRAQHPWLQIIAPERVCPMMQALVQMYKEGGWLPKWPNPTYTSIMIGTHADGIIADAYINGFRDFDVQTAYEAIRKNGTTPPKDDMKRDWRDVNRIRVPEHKLKWQTDGYEARGGLTHYLKKGYVAADFTRESASRTLEFALGDYCIAQMARALGKNGDYEFFMRNAQNYKNLFNKQTGFFHARNSDGSFHRNPNEGFTEVNNWNYRFCAMQDVPGLAKLMGGGDVLIANLDEFFDGGHYAHNNEPSHHCAYLYDYCGRLDKTQLRVPQILAQNYSSRPDGLSGNDDCGQMSAWYVYGCLGFYPVCAASGEYALGIPKFKKISVKLRGGKTLEIVADKAGEEKVLTNVSFNGRKLEKPFVKVADILGGGTLKFEK